MTEAQAGPHWAYFWRCFHHPNKTLPWWAYGFFLQLCLTLLWLLSFGSVSQLAFFHWGSLTSAGRSWAATFQESSNSCTWWHIKHVTHRHSHILLCLSLIEVQFALLGPLSLYWCLGQHQLISCFLNSSVSPSSREHNLGFSQEFANALELPKACIQLGVRGQPVCVTSIISLYE